MHPKTRLKAAAPIAVIAAAVPAVAAPPKKPRINPFDVASTLPLQAPPFDLVYDRAFLCELPRPRWGDCAQRMAQLVRPGGELAGFFFLDDNPKGPPFGTSRAGLAGLLEGAFELSEDRPVPPEQSLPVFQRTEIWQVWKRRL